MSLVYNGGVKDNYSVQLKVVGCIVTSIYRPNNNITRHINTIDNSY